MNYEDDELDDLLKPLKNNSPNDFQMQKWQMAVQGKVRKKSNTVTATRGKWALQLIAAMFIGIVLGAVLYRTIQLPIQAPLVAQFSVEDATFERSHANLD